MANAWKGGLKEAQKRYREKNKEKRNQYNRKWYQKNKDRMRKMQKEYLLKNKEKVYAYNAKWQRGFWSKIREEMIKAYGGKCVCCGESEPIFLDLDHIYNDGKKCREIAKNGRQEMLNLRKAKWPKKRHQLLCSNCNQGKRRNGGICPHKKKDQ